MRSISDLLSISPFQVSLATDLYLSFHISSWSQQHLFITICSWYHSHDHASKSCISCYHLVILGICNDWGHMTFSWVLLLLVMHLVSFSHKRPLLEISLHMLIWLHATHGEHLQKRSLNYPPLAPSSRILPYIVVLKVLFNIWLLLFLIFSTLFIKSVYICMTLGNLRWMRP